jgi:hypothetical protein
MDGNRLPIFPSNKRVFVAVSAACAFACAASVALAQTQRGTIMIAIEKMDIGTAPPDFDFARTGKGGPGQWGVVSDPTASNGRAIEQSSSETTDYRFPLAIYKPLSAKNVEVVVRFKPVAGQVDQAGGIAVRLTGPDDYYVVRANALEDNVRFYHVIKGRRTELMGVNTKVTPNEWHTLGLRAEGDRFTVTFDGKELFTVPDRAITDAGKVALWTKADSVTRFDQFEIGVLP